MSEILNPTKFVIEPFELQTHKPLDLVVLMLGTNDLKVTDAAGSARGVECLVDKLLSANERFANSYPVFPNGAKVLLISPVLVTNNEWHEEQDPVEESHKFAELYRRVAEAAEIEFMDAALITGPSDVDGVHMGPIEHAELAKAVAEKILDIVL